MSRPAGLQAAHLRVEEIADGVVRLRGDQYRAVLEVGSVNFALQGQAEQEATLAGFAAFLNGLTFPVQVLVRVLPLDLEGYLAELERRARRLPDHLVELARDQATFLRRLARSRTLLERRFYLIVPARAEEAGRKGFFFGRRAAALDAAAARKQLTFRCEEVARQLGRCGLAARRLTSVELARLFYSCWCPELSRVQRLGQVPGDQTVLVVGAKQPAGRIE